MDRRAYIEAKFGGLDAFSQMEEHVLAAGAAERIPFAFEMVARTPNTFMAHRLIWYAEQQGCQDSAVESLFRGYFTKGPISARCQSSVNWRVALGLDAAAVESFLHSEEGTTEVKTEEATGHRLGIRGVPYFVLNGSISISGAQPPEIFVSALQQAEEAVIERKAGA